MFSGNVGMDGSNFVLTPFPGSSADTKSITEQNLLGIRERFFPKIK